MRAAEREVQASAFLDFHRRRGGDWESAFAVWSASKDFAPHDEHSIRRLLEAELIGGGRAVITDLEYTPPPARWPRRMGRER